MILDLIQYIKSGSRSPDLKFQKIKSVKYPSLMMYGMACVDHERHISSYRGFLCSGQGAQFEIDEKKKVKKEKKKKDDVSIAASFTEPSSCGRDGTGCHRCANRRPRRVRQEPVQQSCRSRCSRGVKPDAFVLPPPPDHLVGQNSPILLDIACAPRHADDAEQYQLGAVPPTHSLC